MVERDPLGDVAPERMTNQDRRPDTDGIHEADDVAREVADAVTGLWPIRAAEPSLRECVGMDRAGQALDHRLE